MFIDFLNTDLHFHCQLYLIKTKKKQVNQEKNHIKIKTVENSSKLDIVRLYTHLSTSHSYFSLFSYRATHNKCTHLLCVCWNFFFMFYVLNFLSFNSPTLHTFHIFQPTFLILIFCPQNNFFHSSCVSFLHINVFFL